MTSEDEYGYSLAHPVYLDVPMMISFLAHLEGGLTTNEEETRAESGARERALKGRAGFRFRLPLVTDADAGTDFNTARQDSDSLEVKSQRLHTAASWFNTLYGYLHEDQQVTVLSGPDDLTALRSGQLVEIAGEYLGNPLEDTLAFIGSIMPYVLEQQEVEKANVEQALQAAKKAQRSGNPARRASAVNQPELDVAAVLQGVLSQSQDAQTEFGVRMMTRMVAEMDHVPVHDLVLLADGGLRAVLTVSSEFYSQNTNQYLKQGDFRVIGKVTRVLTGDRTINLTRRTVLGAAGPEVAQNIVESMRGDALSLEVADPIVAAPAVQILPMAIFV